MNQVCENHSPIIIIRQKAEPVVMLSLADYNSLRETAYLLENPANAEHLRQSIRQAEAGELIEVSLTDL